MSRDTKRILLEQGMAMLLRQGFNNLGIAEILAATSVPRGSFYYYFKSKEDFALQVVDLYMHEVHAGLEHCLGDQSRAPMDRVRHFFELTEQKYRSEGYLGCLLGGLGQELSGVSELFRGKVEQCLAEIGRQIAVCLQEALERGDLPEHTDPLQLAELLVNCWEGAALRTRLRRDPGSLSQMLDFYFRSVSA